MNNMADFLNQLPTVEQPPHSECVICLLPYGAAQDEGTIEHPVRLPCNHIVGSNCISQWLHPDKEAKNSCPLCRRKFFAGGNMLVRTLGDDSMFRVGRNWWVPEASELRTGHDVWGREHPIFRTLTPQQDPEGLWSETGYERGVDGA
ncbi:MAG: hypothetical protein ASARMPREDX12_002032 [Alectoria sarmentosa]|nr:MAG: hypothetical protein ASARMPREDX12_002032 [Alectoria sarmentosa]